MEQFGAEISNPVSTGGAGNNFECHVQTLFAVLMLAGGVCPCLPNWPASRIQLQGKHDGYQTDDVIVFARNPDSGQEAKLLGQIRLSVAITKKNKKFGKVIRRALEDFRNPQLFNEKTDAIALITGPLSASDNESVRSLRDLAQYAPTAKDFLGKFELAKFMSETKRQKFRAIRAQLKAANDGEDLPEDELWRFMKSFHFLSYDLEFSSGATLSLIQSVLAQFGIRDVAGLWGKVNEEVRMCNQNAGTLLWDNVSEDLRQTFSKRIVSTPARDERTPPAEQDSQKQVVERVQGVQADAMVIAALAGGFNDKKKADLESLNKLVGGDD
ncbi:MAG: hypothetical protein PCFJNLEI_01774 [Verrucomicrobiae bacterium]|nr:hypothetical protein [Verrucomicrobiae bacterium]